MKEKTAVWLKPTSGRLVHSHICYLDSLAGCSGGLVHVLGYPVSDDDRKTRTTDDF